MKASLLLLFAVTVFKAGFSQSSRESMEALSQLRFMEGTWKGAGWIQTGDKKQSFRETETVTGKLSGSAMQIEAYGTALEDSSTVINDALGVISFNLANKNYRLRIFQADGSFAEAEARLLNPSTFEFRLKYPGGFMKYIIIVNNKNWKESGYRSTDGKAWTQTFEMELTRQ